MDIHEQDTSNDHQSDLESGLNGINRASSDGLHHGAKPGLIEIFKNGVKSSFIFRHSPLRSMYDPQWKIFLERKHVENGM